MRVGQTRWRAALVAAVAAIGMVGGASAPARAAGPPDAVEPPVPGEGQPLDDPSEPAGALQYAGHPGPRVQLAGPSFPAQAVERIAGADRIDTAVQAARAGWPNAVGAVVIAPAHDFPDALVATGLAGVVGGPLLLTPRDALHVQVHEEVRRLNPAVIYGVGLTETALAALTAEGRTVERITGTDRYDTAYRVALRARELGADTSTLLLASGTQFADALALSALAAGLRHPLLYWPHGEVGRAYGVFNEAFGWTDRGTFIVDREGIVRYAVVNGLTDARDTSAYRAALAAL